MEGSKDLKTLEESKFGERLYSTSKLERWVAKLVAHLLATVALWVRIQTSLKKKWAT
jgi:hypothetical protein